MEKSKQIVGLDIVRYLAAFIVMIYHLSYTTWAVDSSTSKDFFDRWKTIYQYPELSDFARMGWIGVEIFFVLSGFVIVYSAAKGTAAKFAFGRFIRLYPAAWICATISVLLVSALTYHDFDLSITFKYIKSMLLFPFGPWIDGAYWTLGVELSFYFLVFLALCLNARQHLDKITAAIGIASSFFQLYILYLYNTDGINEVSAILKSTRFINLLLLGHGIFFSIGALLYKYASKRFGTIDFILLIIFFAFGFSEIFIGTIVKSSREANIRGVIDGAAPALLWLACMFLMFLSIYFNEYFSRKLSETAVKRVRHIGLTTYPLYLVHSTVGAALLVVFGWFGFERWTALILSFSGCVLTASVITSKLEDPLQKFIRAKVKF